jgi:hypothetical protein
MYSYQIEYKQSATQWRYIKVDASCISHARLLARGLDIVSIRRVD